MKSTNSVPSLLASKNFLKLCKVKYYNNCIFHNIQHDYIVQTGDPTATGRGGQSIQGLLYGDQANYFKDEIVPSLRHKEIGVVSMANKGPNLNASQFFITTGPNLESLDGKHTIFGQVVEGLETLLKINNAFCDRDGKPLQVIRIRHTIVLDDPFPDPSGLEVPDKSPLPLIDAPKGLLGEDTLIQVEEKLMNPEEMEQLKDQLEDKQARTRAEVLEILGDIPDAEIKPDRNVLFVCQLNPLTTDDDLELIFSRFGKIKSCEILKDKKTGDSLQYAFIEFIDEKAADQAYFKMNKVLIDDRRIHVDFSQSVSRADFSAEHYRRLATQLNRAENDRRGNTRGGMKRPRLEGRQMGGGDFGLVLEDDDGDRAAKKSRVDDRRHSDKREGERRPLARSGDRSRDNRRDGDRRGDERRDGRDRGRERDRGGHSGRDDRRDRERRRSRSRSPMRDSDRNRR